MMNLLLTVVCYVNSGAFVALACLANALIREEEFIVGAICSLVSGINLVLAVQGIIEISKP